uniref:Nuclear transcription factor Y subunit beta n=2 Tax=Rhodnius TaxID=13248 RepID=A0A4P6D9U2_RHOPR
MDNAESGDELGTSFLHSDAQSFLVHEDMDEELELTAENTDDSSHDADKMSLVLREQDRFLPIANVAKIMKKAIPESGKIAKDARECVQECVSEFISFITSEASDRCHMEKRKTINGEDILFAMTTLGFDNYVEPLKLYLLKYREATKGVKPLAASEIYEDSNDEVFSKLNISVLNKLP